MLEFFIITSLVAMNVAVGFQIYNELDKRLTIKKIENEVYETTKKIKKDLGGGKL